MDATPPASCAWPLAFQVFKNGIRLSISGGVIVQIDQYKDMIHLGFANNGEVTWLDFRECGASVGPSHTWG